MPLGVAVTGLGARETVIEACVGIVVVVVAGFEDVGLSPSPQAIARHTTPAKMNRYFI